MSKFCGKCGKEIKEEFCTNCGAKASEAKETKNSDMEQYFHDKMMNKKKHNFYRTSTGILMIILGFLVFIAGVCYDDLDINVDINGASTVLAFVLPGLFSFFGGIFSIASKKNNSLLIASSGLFILAAVFNAVAIQDVSLLFILCAIFVTFNIIYYNKTEKLEE